MGAELADGETAQLGWCSGPRQECTAAGSAGEVGWSHRWLVGELAPHHCAHSWEWDGQQRQPIIGHGRACALSDLWAGADAGCLLRGLGFPALLPTPQGPSCPSGQDLTWGLMGGEAWCHHCCHQEPCASYAVMERNPCMHGSSGGAQLGGGSVRPQLPLEPHASCAMARCLLSAQPLLLHV